MRWPPPLTPAKDQTGYYWQTANGGKQLMYQGKRVAVVSDIDDTLVDGVHYTANILGRNGEWTNKSFADFVMSDGCTALPGAVEFINHCVENGIEVYYVTNRYDQGYKTSQPSTPGRPVTRQRMEASSAPPCTRWWARPSMISPWSPWSVWLPHG